jgi:hypothetical protein
MRGGLRLLTSFCGRERTTRLTGNLPLCAFRDSLSADAVCIFLHSII